ncbi:MAG: hypothetical protein NTX65_07375 [Ignavibacteriales bacterium]|nr:hypothetical protein [Ignavibacteriales bacterium]
MKKLLLSFIPLLLLLILFSSVSNAQGKLGVIGAMFDKREANILFGKVIGSLTISVADLQAALDKGKDYILITVKNNQVVIRNEKRDFLSRERVDMGRDEKMYMFSKSMIRDLLKAKKTGKHGTSELGANTMSTSATASDLITVEVRASVISLSYGDATLERAMDCPPWCPNE